MALDVDHRLVVLTKRAFRAATVLPRRAFLDHVRLVIGCSTIDAIRHMHELEAAGLVVIRGASTAALLHPAQFLDTGHLKTQRIDIQYRLETGDVDLPMP